MGTIMKSSKLFITGADANTKWMLPWFESNFRKHMPDAKLMVYDFDEFNPVSGMKNWFKKPFAMQAASKLSDSVCWIDSDIEIRANVEDIFTLCEPNRLAMVEDAPWTIRRKETWHNSGVVCFCGKPNILDMWAAAVLPLPDNLPPMYGDQDVLHAIVRTDMKRRIHITDLPRAYNTLRLDLIDNTAPPNIKMMHWTGAKGKEKIREQMNG